MTFSKVSFKKLISHPLPLETEVMDGGRILTPSGELTQIANNLDIKFLAYVEFRDSFPRASRGNHYHASREEYLYILKGRLRAIYRDLDNDEIAEFYWETGDFVLIKPRCAHLYFADEYTQAIEFSSSVYDPADTHSYQVLS